METDKVITADGRSLAATFTDAASPLATAVIGSATGVPRRFYEPFARFLAEGGISTVAFDYRGIADSRTGPVRKEVASMNVWGERDLAAALAAMEARVPKVPRLYVGHSVGAQVIALAEGSERLAAAIFVAGQSGYWKHWPFPRSLLMGSLWFAVIPAATALLGRLPMGAAGGEDLPRGVARQWAAWGRDPGYVLSHSGAAEALARLELPIRDYALADDHYAPRRSIEALLSYYKGAATEIRDVRPHDVGAKRIGHFGFFREKFREPLWTEAREWLLARATARGSAPAARHRP